MATVAQSGGLVKDLLSFLSQDREWYSQTRIGWRGIGLVMGEILALGQHRISDLLVALGCANTDWTAWYRLLSVRGRFNEEAASDRLVKESLAQVGTDEVYVVAVDSTQVPRSSQKMEGSSWLKNPRTPPFKIGIHRAQRFVNLSWLTPQQAGFRRAIPLRWLPAFPEKAVLQAHQPVKEQVVGVEVLQWLRQRLTQEGRARQPLLILADGSYDKPDFWKGLPTDSAALVRTARNRVLYHLPMAADQTGRGRPRLYGKRALAPQDYLSLKFGWTTTWVQVRGHERKMTYRVEGPFIRQTASAVALMLIVVKGQTWNRAGRGKRRPPVFYLVNAVWRDGQWQLLLPIDELLTAAWQRWEVEVVHREVKFVFGLGDKQCWHPRSAVTSVQWSAWVYAVLILLGYRHLGLPTPQSTRRAWYPHPKRWSLTDVLDLCRHDLYTLPEFNPFFPASSDNWPKMEAFLSHYCSILPHSPSFFP